VGFVQSVEGLNRTKRLTLPQVREFSLLDCLHTGTSAFFLPSYSNGNIGSSWISRLLAFYFLLSLHHRISRFSGLQTQNGTKPSALLGLQLTDSPCRSWGLASLCNFMNQFLIINLSLRVYVYVFPTGSASLENSNTDT